MKQISKWLHCQDPERNLKWLADQLGLSQHTVKKWGAWDSSIPVPPKHCRAIELITRGAFTVHDLRPDIFGQKQNVA